jgi:hypothetical protein
MTLKQAIKCAIANYRFSVYRKSQPSILRGILTEFTDEDRRARDWDVLPPEPERAL